MQDLTKKIKDNIHLEDGLSIYSVKWKTEDKMKILEVLIDGNVTSDITDHYTHLILDLINDDLPDDAYLEVSSVGLEKELDIEKLVSYTNSYVYLTSKEYNGYGTLVSVDTKQITLVVNQKGRIKNIVINKNDINFIRSAVKV